MRVRPAYFFTVNSLNFKEFVSKDDYEVFAGSNWPSYDEFIEKIKIKNPNIKIEIDNFVMMMHDQHLVRQEQQRKKIKHNSFKFLLTLLGPAVLGLFLFVFNFSSWANFFFLLLTFWFINLLHNVTVHRWLSHEQFEPKWYFRPLLLWNLTLVGCWRPLDWVKWHKSHHFNADTESDPYPPGIGFWRLLFGPHQSYCDYRPTKELQRKDIQFVDKYYFWLYTANLIVFFFIDPNIVFLSLIFLRFYTVLSNACQNWIMHGADRNGQPTNVPVLYELVFSGDALHKNHHEKPFLFNYGWRDRRDWLYFLLQFVAKK